MPELEACRRAVTGGTALTSQARGQASDVGLCLELPKLCRFHTQTGLDNAPLFSV